jgi:hypothetical protein
VWVPGWALASVLVWALGWVLGWIPALVMVSRLQAWLEALV